MKKSILFIAVLFSVVTLNAENNQFLYEGRDIGFIPKELVKSGSPRMNVVSDHEVLLYDNQFRLSKSIPMDEIELTYITNEYKKNIIDYSYSINLESSYPVYDYDGNYLHVSSIQEAIEYLNIHWSYPPYTFVEHTGITNLESAIYSNIRNDNSFVTEMGDTLPDMAFFIQDGLLYYVYLSEIRVNKTYGSELTYTRGDTSNTICYEPRYYTYIDADNGTFSYYCGAPITQVLFNTDEAYEYIHYIVDPNLEEVVEGPNPIPSDNRWNDVNDYAYKSFTNNVIGFEIKSDNGNVVQSVRFDYNFRMYRSYLQDIYLLKLDNIYYLCFKGSTDNSYTASRMLIYYVGAAGSGAPLHEVAAPIATAVRKYIEAGQVYIKKDNNLYNMSGAMAK